MNENSVFKKNPNFITRTIDDETILLPVMRNSSEMNCIYNLNKSASRVWGLINGKRTFRDIKVKLEEEFEGTPNEIRKKLSDFLEELKQIQALQLRNKSGEKKSKARR